MIPALLLLFAGDALAARNEISFDIGGSAPQDAVARSELNTYLSTPQVGVRAGWAALRDRQRFGLVLGASWSRSSTSGAVGSESWYATDGEAVAIEGMVVSLHVDRVGVGLKADYDVAGVFFPYVRADARLLVGGGRTWADQADAIDRPLRGLGGGALVTAGFELMVPDVRLHIPATAAVYWEVGYEADSGLKVGDLGSINLSGFAMRGGVGVRF